MSVAGGQSAAYTWMPCRKHGGIGDEVHCQTCREEQPPPGESGRELTGIDALALLDEALQDITKAPRMAIKGVKDIDVRKVGGWVVVRVKFKGTKDANEVTFRIRKSWAQVLRSRLNTVLEK